MNGCEGVGVLQRVAHCFCESGCVAAGIDVTGSAVSDEVADGANAIAGDDGAAAEHRFVDDEAEGFVGGGDDHEVCGFVESWELGLVDEAEELDFVCDVEGVGCVFDFGALGAIACEDQSCVWDCGGGEGVEEIERALPGLEFGAEQDDFFVRLCAELFA